jgi:site-specific DNA recombinase
MLKNEKYKGDSLLKKSYTKDFLTKKRAVNDGIVPKYYVKGSHMAIIDRITWEAVQMEFERRKNYMKKYNIKQLDFLNSNPFRAKVICGYCKKIYGRVTWNSNDEKLKRVIWQCSNKYRAKGKIGCFNKHIDEADLYNIFVKAYNKLSVDKDVDKWNKMLKSGNYLDRIIAKRFIDILSRGEIDKFDEELFLKLVEKLVVLDGKIEVCFLDGSLIEI